MINIKNAHTAPIVITDSKGEKHFLLSGESKDIDVDISDNHVFKKAGWIKTKPTEPPKPEADKEQQKAKEKK